MKKIIKKGWIVAIGLSSRERQKIKFYLTKKRAIDGDDQRKNNIRRATLTYEI